jgi:hypothetical protein
MAIAGRGTELRDIWLLAIRVESGFSYVVSGSDMAGDEPTMAD